MAITNPTPTKKGQNCAFLSGTNCTQFWPFWVQKGLKQLDQPNYYIIYGRTHGAPFCGYGYVPLSNGGNVVTRMGTQQQLLH